MGMPGMRRHESANDPTKNNAAAKSRQWLLLLLAFVVGMFAGINRIDQPTLALFFIVLGLAAFLYQSWRRTNATAADSGAWQREIDRTYTLEIKGLQISLYKNQQLDVQFEWNNVIELQYLSRKKVFAPLFWKVVTEQGEFCIPDGGRYHREFLNLFVYRLPDYHEQRVVRVSPPAGFSEAKSMWRKDDTYPKRKRSMDEYDWV